MTSGAIQLVDNLSAPINGDALTIVGGTGDVVTLSGNNDTLTS